MAEIFDEGVRVEFARDVPCLSFRENLREHFTFVSVKLYITTQNLIFPRELTLSDICCEILFV